MEKSEECETIKRGFSRVLHKVSGAAVDAGKRDDLSQFFLSLANLIMFRNLLFRLNLCVRKNITSIFFYVL